MFSLSFVIRQPTCFGRLTEILAALDRKDAIFRQKRRDQRLVGLCSGKTSPVVDDQNGAQTIRLFQGLQKLRTPEKVIVATRGGDLGMCLDQSEPTQLTKTLYGSTLSIEPDATFSLTVSGDT